MISGKPPAQPNLSLIDGLNCLQTLAANRDPIGSRELALMLGLEPTRVNRLLKTLAYLGLAEQDQRRKYRTGPALHVLAASSLFGSGLLRGAIGPLDSLAEYGHTVAMGVLWRDKICYLYYADPTLPESGAARGLGHSETYPAVSSGVGLALLAHTSRASIDDLYGPDAESATDDVVPALEGSRGLHARLQRVREDGYALATFPERRRRTLAVPVGKTPYAAIGLSGLIDDAEIARLLPPLRQAAAQIDRNTNNKE